MGNKTSTANFPVANVIPVYIHFLFAVQLDVGLGQKLVTRVWGRIRFNPVCLSDQRLELLPTKKKRLKIVVVGQKIVSRAVSWRVWTRLVRGLKAWSNRDERCPFGQKSPSDCAHYPVHLGCTHLSPCICPHSCTPWVTTRGYSALRSKPPCHHEWAKCTEVIAPMSPQEGAHRCFLFSIQCINDTTVTDVWYLTPPPNWGTSIHKGQFFGCK